MESALLRIKVAAQSLRATDEFLNSLPDNFDEYDRARASYALTELERVKAEMGKGPFQTSLKTAITKMQKNLRERS